MDKEPEAVARLIQSVRRFINDHDEKMSDIPIQMTSRSCGCSLCREGLAALDLYAASRLDSTVDRLHEAMNAPSGECGHCQTSEECTNE